MATPTFTEYFKQMFEFRYKAEIIFADSDKVWSENIMGNDIGRASILYLYQFGIVVHWDEMVETFKEMKLICREWESNKK